MITLAPDEFAILSALRAFLVAVMPAGFDPDNIVKGQLNRVGEPSSGDFLVMWPISRPRLSTNIDEYVDTSFEGSISAATMTVTDVEQGSIGVGATVFGVDVAAGTTVSAQVSGDPGGVGVYTVAPAQTLSARTLACGHVEMTQETEIVVQVDVHSADVNAAGDLCARIATAFRDDYACRIIEESNPAVSPLFADDPRQTPFVNAEQQYETRWTVDLHLQADQKLTGIPQQFASSLEVEVISVDAEFPPN